MKSSFEIRETFLKYFEDRGHRRIKSSSLIPAADPTLLFTNAGMVQFKDIFLGIASVDYRRATTCQKCVRAGGKHNDLENVGYTPRHHTFFEMLGNFSFGDYFKKDAIAFAWELFTKIYGIDKDRLWVTVFENDDEAFQLWVSQGVSKDRIGRLGEKDNFWAMGDTGPCGPCTEIHYDWGESYGCGKKCVPGAGCGRRFLEIANLVFMQYNRSADGKLTPLPKPSVDTGTGLERLTAVLCGAYSNYDTDLFRPLLSAIGEISHKKYGDDEDLDVSFRVIADHLRSSTFLLADGVTPSNEGRGYVLRRILRRAMRHAKKLGLEKPFIFELVGAVEKSLGNIYPELGTHAQMIALVLKEEEEKFHETLHRGMGLLEATIAQTKEKKGTILPGDVVFKLYDTFGFPVDLIEVICKEQGIGIDEKAYEKKMAEQRKKSVWTKKGNLEVGENCLKILTQGHKPTVFLGYQTLSHRETVKQLFSVEGNALGQLKTGESGLIYFEKTPFYAESGGQVGDQGKLVAENVECDVQTVFRAGPYFLHQVLVRQGSVNIDQKLNLVVDPRLRQLTAINHTATHLLHRALRNVLGARVKQAGSLVDSERLRFDFTYPQAVTDEQIHEIELLVNREIQKKVAVSVEELAFDDAIKTGALAFFDEKYGDRVRVVRVGDGSSAFSIELCGGTHLKNTADIGCFKILRETSIASGTRRIEAITSDRALEFLLKRHEKLQEVEIKLASNADTLVEKVGQLLSEVKELTLENDALKLKLARLQTSDSGGKLWDKKKTVKQYQLVGAILPATPAKILRSLVDEVRDKLKNRTVVLLGSEEHGKVCLCLGLSKDLTDQWDASKMIQVFAAEVHGTGGGRRDFAQAGGSYAEGLSAAIQKLEKWVEEHG